MKKVDHPRFLDHHLDTKRRLFLRYLYSYKKAYHDISWEIEECSLLIRTKDHTKYNDWKLNEVLYDYAEASISALSWLLGETPKHPFVHQFLREWRNEYHHEAKNDFVVYDVKVHVDDKSFEFSYDHFILPYLVGNDRMKKLLKRWFDSDRIATDATVRGLVYNHHVYMLRVFQNYETNLNKDMPEKYLIATNQSIRSLGGGKYDSFVHEQDFWSHGN